MQSDVGNRIIVSQENFKIYGGNISPVFQKVRMASLCCLAAMTSLPHPVLYPHQKNVIKELAVSIDDHKRLVRKEAVQARSLW